MSDTGWKAVEMKHLKDPDGVDWKIQHRLANIRYEEYDDAVNIKIYRDSKADRIYSAAYMRNTDMKGGGIYDVSFYNQTLFIIILHPNFKFMLM